MITRKLIAALVGVSLAAGTFGIASAQTAQAPAIQQSAPVKAGDVASTPASSTLAKQTKVKAKTHMTKKVQRKHLAHRTPKTAKVALHGKRTRMSHAGGKRTTKQV